MPKRISQNDLSMIIEAVAAFPEGAGIEEIEATLKGKVSSRRTLQRRLATLVEQKELIVEGHARARRYRLPLITAEVHGTLAVQGTVDVEPYVPLSSQGKSIKQAIHQPIQNRNPVGYNRAFLDSYRPNVTSYLTLQICDELNSMGRLPDDQRPAGTYARQIFHRLLIDLSWNSSRLEGNTYSLLETERLLEIGETADGKNAMEAQMILNHKAAIELLVKQAEEIGFNRYTILNLHALLSDNLLSDPQAGGRLRTIPVGIGGTVYHPLEIPQLVDECMEQVLEIVNEIKDPFEQSFFVMVHLPYLQPFEDVNKRVSRLAANISLIRENCCPLSFVDVPEQAYIDGIVAVYELNRIDLLRDVFIWAYKRSCGRYSAIRQSLGEPDLFRLHYRGKIKETVVKVVRYCLDKKAAVQQISREAALKIPVHDRSRFVEIVETELSSLHEGNFARYDLRPEEFLKWQEGWR